MGSKPTDQHIVVEDLTRAALQYGSFCSGSQLDSVASAFLTQIAQDATEDDVEGLTVEDLAALADGFWRWTSQKRADSQEMRLIEGKGAGGRSLGRDILEICGPDMPFLVDSVMGEIGAQSVEVRALFHPIIQVPRDGDGARSHGHIALAESLIQIHMPPIAPSKRDAILMGLRETLHDVRLCVGDFYAMRARMNEAIKELSVAQTKASADEIGESISFLKWLANDNFIFFGVRSYDYPRDDTGALANEEPQIREELNLGILRDPLRMVLRRLNEPSVLTDAVRAYLEEPSPIIVAKSNLRSRVHRRTVIDYIGIKRYSETGEVLGEDRFLGLFTAEAYDKMVRDVPLLRGKIDRVIARANLVPGSHNDKRFRNIVENYPRDELFQIEDSDLLRIALGIQHLMDRPRSKLFVRRDRFDRFLSILVYVPRDRFNSTVRARIGDLLAGAYQGRLSAFYPMFGDQPLARVHYIIGVTPNAHADPDLAVLEAQINDITRTWEDGLEALGEDQALIVSRYLTGFPAGYRESFDAREALVDIGELEQVGSGAVRVRAYRRADDGEGSLRAKLYKAGEPTALSAAIPIFESMGLFVESEAPFAVSRQSADGPQRLWIQDVWMRTGSGGPLDFSVVESSFEGAFSAIWSGQAENDGFNRLILKLGVSWREAALIRALARWRGQTGLDPSESVQQQAVSDYPDITRAILDLFKARFDPKFGAHSVRENAAKALNETIGRLLDGVPNLDADRVLRRLTNLVNAIVRTNFYQPSKDGTHKSYMSFKISPRELVEVPAPKPFREIWVWSPEVEGAHLRFGPVARGGLRWSDRRDDFRTEVLGLVKAQQVKNAVIVPVGSKGAFFPKLRPRNGSREDVQAAAIQAYKTFLHGLLDLTDNLDGEGVIVPPADIVRWDGDDPYLVVAADKGTATFSDIANAISADYGFWLGDAFASGGSVGYDHKKMAITARGAFEAVKRHFREMGADILSEPFTVIGVGDMSGDVFGNGMLLSKQIKLIAAFDHRDIFIDPDPDMATSFDERARLFALPRSSWADYDGSLISQGGGVFSRSAKKIVLSPQIKSLTGLDGDEVAPTELMHALLKSPCDLLWFGGIGTYVKAGGEVHGDAGDKANDLIRIDGGDLRCKVVGEGANLALTQRGRIEAALAGVRLNTDAIDNSAGVDSSDHEVNIKILLNGLVRSGKMSLKDRDKLLASMTDDVARHVLRHNYDQTLAISRQEDTAVADMDGHQRFIERLEKSGQLDRKIEFLPDGEALGVRRAMGKGLTRPELSVLTAYAKLSLFDALMASDIPDDPWFEGLLIDYFPQGCRALGEGISRHRLRREIIATVLSNKMINLGGAIFVDKVQENGSLDLGLIGRGFVAACVIFDLDRLIAEINQLDLKVDAPTQLSLMADVTAMLYHQTYCLARRASGGEGKAHLDVAALVDRYRDRVGEIGSCIFDMISAAQHRALRERITNLLAVGVPEALAQSIAALMALISATDIVDLAKDADMPTQAVGRLYHAVGATVGLDDVRAAASLSQSTDHWERLATRGLIEAFLGGQKAFTASLCDHATARQLVGHDAGWALKVLQSWTVLNANQLDRTRQTTSDLKASGGGWTFAKLSIASAEISALADGVLS